MIRLTVIGLMLILLLAPLAHAQVGAPEAPVEDFLESLLDTTEDEDLTTERMEQLLDLAANPPNLNTVEADLLVLMPSFSQAAARRLLRHREEHGPYSSWEAMDDVEGLTAIQRESLRTFFVIAEVPSAPSPLRSDLQTLSVDWIQRVTRRLDLGRGYDRSSSTTHYLGAPERVYSRLRLRTENHLQGQLTLDKAPGEPFQWSPGTSTYGFDHAAFHLAVRDWGPVRQLVVGDFTVEMGQGLTLGRQASFRKGRDAVGPPLATSRGVVPYGSTDPNRFFRGIAATFTPIDGWTVSAFASRRGLDATVDTLAQSPVVTGRPTSGLHRTPTERQRKHAVRETLVGGAVQTAGQRGRLGGTAYASRFSLPHALDATPQTRHRFTGTHAAMGSLFGDLYLGPWHGFAEWARGAQGGWGVVGGLTGPLGPTADVMLLARHYDPRFISLHGHAFGEQSRVQNETGIYLGVQLTPHPNWQIGGYLDQFRFPWLRFRAARPSTGTDGRLVVTYRPSPRLMSYVQLRTKTVERTHSVRDTHDRVLAGLAEETRTTARVHVRHRPASWLQLQTRLEVSRHQTGTASPETGTLLYQDVRWQPRSWLQLDGRLAFFDTESFDARLWAYEQDLLYTFAVPAFHGQGQRSYLLARVQPLSAITVQVKYGVTRWQHVTTVGSGLDTVEGNRIRELRGQLRIQL